MTSAQERAILNSTLACMIKSMTGVRTTVELRNESFVSGKGTLKDYVFKVSEKPCGK